MSSMEQDPSYFTQGTSPIVPVPFLRAKVAGRRRVNPTSPRPTKRARWCDHEHCMKWVKTNFSRHANSHLPPEEQERIFCSHGCGTSVLKGQGTNLNFHIRRDHTGEYLQCPHCDFRTQDNAEMSRHWTRYHKGKRQPKWPAPRSPSKSQVSSPAATNIPVVGSSSSSFSILQLSPPLPVPSDYGSPPPPSSASSSTSSLYSSNPYSPTFSLAHEFYPWVAEYSAPGVSELASTNLPMPVVPYEHLPPPSAPPPSPLIDHTPLSNFDAPVPQDSYQNVGDESHFGDTDVFLHASPYSPYLVEADALSTNPGFGLFSPTGFGVSGMLNGYPGSAVDGCIGPAPYSTGFSGSLSVGGWSHNDFPPVVPSPQSPLPYPMGTDNTDRWFFPSNVGPTLPVVDSLAEPLWFSPSTSASTPSSSSLYGYGTGFSGRHPAVVGGTPCYHPGSASLPDAGGSQPALSVSNSDSRFETLSGVSGSEHVY